MYPIAVYSGGCSASRVTEFQCTNGPFDVIVIDLRPRDSDGAPNHIDITFRTPTDYTPIAPPPAPY